MVRDSCRGGPVKLPASHDKRDLKKRLRAHPHPLPATPIMGHYGCLAGGEEGLQTVAGDAHDGEADSFMP